MGTMKSRIEAHTKENNEIRKTIRKYLETIGRYVDGDTIEDYELLPSGDLEVSAFRRHGIDSYNVVIPVEDLDVDLDVAKERYLERARRVKEAKDKEEAVEGQRRRRADLEARDLKRYERVWEDHAGMRILEP